MQRSAVSVASNIAEGAERGGRDFARFLTISRGSSSELRTQAYIAGRIKTLSAEQTKHIANETKEINRMLFALGKKITANLNTEN